MKQINTYRKKNEITIIIHYSKTSPFDESTHTVEMTKSPRDIIKKARSKKTKSISNCQNRLICSLISNIDDLIFRKNQFYKNHLAQSSELKMNYTLTSLISLGINIFLILIVFMPPSIEYRFLYLFIHLLRYRYCTL